MRVRVCWSKVDEHGIIVMIESSLRLVQATFIALTLPASFPFVKACQHRLLDRNYFRPSRLGLRGMVKVNKTIEEITKHWNSGVKDKLENARIHPIKFDLHTIVPFVFSHEPWTPSALVCLYHTLVHEFGRKNVDEAIGRYC